MQNLYHRLLTRLLCWSTRIGLSHSFESYIPQSWSCKGSTTSFLKILEFGKSKKNGSLFSKKNQYGWSTLRVDFGNSHIAPWKRSRKTVLTDLSRPHQLNLRISRSIWLDMTYLFITCGSFNFFYGILKNSRPLAGVDFGFFPSLAQGSDLGRRC